MNNEWFYTIRVKYGLNRMKQLYKRARIVYARYIDDSIVEYKNVYQGRIIENNIKKHCKVSELLKHNNKDIYKCYTFNEIKNIYDIVKKEFGGVPMTTRIHNNKIILT